MERGSLPVDCVAPAGDALGESGLWDPDERRFYWVDGVAGVIRWLDADGGCESARPAIEPPLGMIALGPAPGTLLIADAKGAAILNLGQGVLERRADPEGGREGILYNDGKVDSSGRLWLGTYDAGEVEPRGAFWRIDALGPAILVECGAAVFNGPAFSPDGALLYLSDSVGRRILRFTVATSAPFLRERQLFAEFNEDEGLPDGLTCDSDGGLWVAHWGGARVTRFGPGGTRELVVPLPVSNVTSVTFGGPAFDRLYITTARVGLDADQLRAEPSAGHLFACSPTVSGFAAARAAF